MANNNNNAKKSKLRTSEDVYNRLKHDASLNIEGIMVGYEDRFRGIMEIPFEEFTPGGDIPYHRLQYFRNADSYIWDRDTRLDLIFHSGDSHSQFDEQMIHLRELQMQKAIQATLEAAEEEREMADQKARLRLQKQRQQARRDKKIDSYAESEPTPASSSSSSESSKTNQNPMPRTLNEAAVYHFNRFSNQWTATHSSPKDALEYAQEISELKIVTYNVLFDLYDAEVIHSGLRYEALIQLLEKVNADIIAFQEVTPAFLATILNSDWVKSHYFSSCGSDATQVSPYGQLTLSKIPITSMSLLTFPASSKNCVITRMEIGNQPFLFVNLHLTSDHAKNETGPAKRKRQLKDIQTALRYYDQQENRELNAFVTGDFNANDDNPLEILTDCQDLWLELGQPNDPGFTFNPIENPLAKLSSLSGLPRRLDRILYRSHRIHPLSMNFVGKEAIFFPEIDKSLHPSDHYGLLGTFRIIPVEKAPEDASEDNSSFQEEVSIPRDLNTSRPAPTYQTALVIIPPHEFWPQIEDIRLKNIQKVTAMPHITLLFKFWPEEWFSQAEEMMISVLETTEPFEIRLNKFGFFTHEFTCTAFVKPETGERNLVSQLQQRIQELFPECDEVQTRSSTGNGYTPHMTMGSRILNVERASMLTQKWEKDWQPVNFQVNEIYLIAREPKKKFQVKRVLPLKAKPEQKLSLDGILYEKGCFETYQKEEDRATALEICQEVCFAVTATSQRPRFGYFEVIGSCGLNAQTADSDVDILFIAPDTGLTRQQLISKIRNQFITRNDISINAFRIISDAIVPIIHVSFLGIQIDIQLGMIASDIITNYSSLSRIPPEKFQEIFSDNSNANLGNIKILLGFLDNQALIQDLEQNFGRKDAGKGKESDQNLEYLKGKNRCENLLRAVRTWAKVRQINSNSFGFLGGISWAVLVHNFLHQTDPYQQNTESLLKDFFHFYANWDFDNHAVHLPGLANPTELLGTPEFQKSKIWILSPVLPLRNTSRNISISTAITLQAEFRRCSDIINQDENRPDWQQIFQEASPLNPEQFDSFLILEISAESEEGVADIRGRIAGKIMGLISNLEKRNFFVRPFPSPLPLKESNSIGCRYVLGLGPNATSVYDDVTDFQEQFNNLWNQKSNRTLTITQVQSV